MNIVMLLSQSDGELIALAFLILINQMYYFRLLSYLRSCFWTGCSMIGTMVVFAVDAMKKHCF